MGDTLLMLDPALHLAAIVLYAVGAGVEIFAAVYGRGAWARRARALAVAALAVHAAGLSARWFAVGHGPYVTRYEVLSANAWVTVAFFLLVSSRAPRVRALAVVVYPSAFLLVAIGLYTGTEVAQLPPTFSGVWLVLHIAFYFVAFASALLAVSTSVLYMLKHRFSADWLGRMPSLVELDTLAYRVGGLAFAFWGIGMFMGAIWAYYAWGRFWGWDPVETWSLLTWLAFGLYLHLRRFFGWRGLRAAVLLAACFFLAVGTLFFTSLVDGSLHAVYFR